jgi:hypothetical protein
MAPEGMTGWPTKAMMMDFMMVMLLLASFLVALLFPYYVKAGDVALFLSALSVFADPSSGRIV